ncbi:MAG: hypothetical protein K6E74_03195 [Bacilli bacterium]|nr:hypothetical protein [Bacilli bacterium]
MKKRKKIIFLNIVILIVVLSAGITVLASFIFDRSVRDDEVKAGEIEITSKSFLSFAPVVDVNNYASTSDPEYLEAIKQRTANATEIVSSKTVTAYINDDGLSFSLKNEYNTLISNVVLVIENNTISSAVATSGNGDSYAVSINANRLSIKNDTGIEIADCMCTIENNKVTNVSSNGRNELICYANEKGGYSDEDTSAFYLNQLGFSFSFETQIPVYICIHFEDAWYSTKTYPNGNTKTNYIVKGNTYKQTEDEYFLEGKNYYIKNGTSYRQANVVVGNAVPTSGDVLYYEESSSAAFTPSDLENWVYDAATNCAYYKRPFIPTEDNNGMDLTFLIDQDYWYVTPSVASYREAIMVQVSFYVDICQANRAEMIWGVDFNKLGIE